MKALTKTAVAASVLLVCNVASAGNMYFDLGNNSWDMADSAGTEDANSTTGVFNELSFNFTWATSAYDMKDGSLLGDFTDSNDPTTLSSWGIPTSGTAMDGSSTVSLRMPDCAAGECDIDGLSPLVPPLGSDNEGFLGSWDIQVEYTLNGTLTSTGPVYTGGTMDFYFNDISTANMHDELVLTATVTGSNIDLGNLDLFFDITFAKQGFLYIENSSGAFVDAYDGTQTGNYATMALNTNVKPPIPTLPELLLVGDNAIRQASLNGGITANIPEPSTIALLGMGMLGFGVRAYRRNKA